jgi:hypothetical protein
MKVRCLFLFFFLLIFSSSRAQNFFQDKSVVVTGHYGYLWAHRDKIRNLVTGHTSGFQISFQKETDGSKWWQAVHGYPQTGFSFIHLNLANDALLGDANALVAYINFPLKRKESFLFSFHLASGLGYLSKRWSRTGDYKNLAIGSHINAAIQLILETRYRISKKMFFNFNYGITHFSNGSYRVPNLGINNVSVNTGLTYRFAEQTKFLTPEIPACDKSIQVEILYGTGVKESYPPAGEKYFNHTLSGSVLKPLSHKHRVGIGADAFYDLSLQREADSISQTELHRKMFRAGIHLAYEMQINKVTVLFQSGRYFIDRVNQDGHTYNRVGMKYAINKNLFANLSLKTHFFRADFVELGLGWKFRLKKMLGRE